MSELTPEQKLKGSLIFKYLKTGKIPKRKGLFRTIFYLAGQHQYFRGIWMTSSSVTKKRPTIDRTIGIGVRDYVRYEADKKISILEKYFDRYLVEYSTTFKDGYLTVYYSSNQVKWSLIDEDLRTEHSENIIERDHLPRIINYRYENNK